MRLEVVATPHVGHEVYLRAGTSDRQVWADTFTGLYHVPPKSMPTPRTVLDVGANIGLTAAHYRSLWPGADIVAVEMDAENASLILRNARVKARVGVVAGRPGWGSYDLDASEDAYAFEAGRVGVARQVARTLRTTILRAFPDPHVVDFVKLDVEGAEWEILERPDWAPLVRHLLVELHGGEIGYGPELVRRAVALLAAAGYRAEPHLRHPQAVFARKER